MVAPNYKVYGDDETLHVRFADVRIQGQTRRLSGIWYINIREPLSDMVSPLQKSEPCRFYTDTTVPIIWIGGSTTMGLHIFLEYVTKGVFQFDTCRESNNEPIPFERKEQDHALRIAAQNGNLHHGRLACLDHRANTGAARSQTRELVGV